MFPNDPADAPVALAVWDGLGVFIGPDETVWGPVCGVARRRKGVEWRDRNEAGEATDTRVARESERGAVGARRAWARGRRWRIERDMMPRVFWGLEAGVVRSELDSRESLEEYRRCTPICLR